MIYMSNTMFNAIKLTEDRIMYAVANNGSSILNLIRHIKSQPNLAVLEVQMDAKLGGYSLTIGANQTGAFNLARAMRKVSKSKPEGPEKIRVQSITFYYCGANDSDDLDVCSDFMDLTHSHNAFRVWFKNTDYLSNKLLRILTDQQVKNV